APPRVETDRVALFVIRRVTCSRGAQGPTHARIRLTTVRNPAVHRAAGQSLLEGVAPSGAGRGAIGVEPRENRLHVQPFERRELWADDERVVLTAVGPSGRQRSVPSGQLVLDVHPGKVILDIRRKGRVQVQPREVAVRVVHLVVGNRAERLTARAGHGQDRDERQEAVLAGQVELRVDPLDLEQTGDVGVDVQAPARGAGAFATSCKAASRTRAVAGEAAVVRARLAVVQVELDTEHGLGAADGELEVRAEARARVPLTVVVAAEV